MVSKSFDFVNVILIIFTILVGIYVIFLLLQKIFGYSPSDVTLMGYLMAFLFSLMVLELKRVHRRFDRMDDKLGRMSEKVGAFGEFKEIVKKKLKL